MFLFLCYVFFFFFKKKKKKKNSFLSHANNLEAMLLFSPVVSERSITE